MNGGIDVSFKHQLRDSVTIPEMDENDSPKIATAMHPAHQQRAIFRIGCA